ncbi:TPA: tetratricopeptide repeat protein, partial [Candidatus Poribacteria bacterium]|nr:tetratricopeptide repeat protein [Candidatus Poribacteria bacterium]
MCFMKTRHLSFLFYLFACLRFSLSVVNFSYPISEEAWAYYWVAVSYSKDGDFDAAAEQYKQAILLEPNFAEAHAALGSVYQIKGLFGDAISELKKAINIDPTFAKAYTNLGLIYS